MLGLVIHHPVLFLLFLSETGLYLSCSPHSALCCSFWACAWQLTDGGMNSPELWDLRTGTQSWRAQETDRETDYLSSAYRSQSSGSPLSSAKIKSQPFQDSYLKKMCCEYLGRYSDAFWLWWILKHLCIQHKKFINIQAHTCMLVMASCSCSRWCAELKASRRMSVSFRSFSHSSERSSVTTLSSATSSPSQSLKNKRSHR